MSFGVNTDVWQYPVERCTGIWICWTCVCTFMSNRLRSERRFFSLQNVINQVLTTTGLLILVSNYDSNLLKKQENDRTSSEKIKLNKKGSAHQSMHLAKAQEKDASMQTACVHNLPRLSTPKLLRIDSSASRSLLFVSGMDRWKVDMGPGWAQQHDRNHHRGKNSMETGVCCHQWVNILFCPAKRGSVKLGEKILCSSGRKISQHLTENLLAKFEVCEEVHTLENVWFSERTKWSHHNLTVLSQFKLWVLCGNFKPTVKL